MCIWDIVCVNGCEFEQTNRKLQLLTNPMVSFAKYSLHNGSIVCRSAHDNLKTISSQSHAAMLSVCAKTNLTFFKPTIYHFC